MPRKNEKKRCLQGFQVVPQYVLNGHSVINLVGKHGHVLTIRVKDAMWKTVRGPIPPGFRVAHRDGDITNNSLTSLQLLPGSDD
ncbi:hypothetical protein BC940DRAFT_300163 [Gongronella butleri]|nr:hypothetical protein BC940DRAFT_300163 [Gongronella butleri]